ncbi:putative pectinesterase/pectinesterase inhibitor 26 [Prunus dulcis]|uniref:putative pectinesterase/pectinesterase inhibitor 26 n=1 Tax=Prunus dulcis TaxID=3755 RepID=UPI00148389F0|nr:putative pectinesterase/pectinesterase inhibitor 26 [Prunus dulcis]
MELINSRVFLLVLLVLLISISSGQVSSRPTPQADAAVENICAKTTNSALCSSTVLPNLRGNADPTTVLQIEMKACLDLTKGALGQLKKTASNPSTSPADVSSIKVCQEVYESAVDDINGASEAIAARDVGTLQTRLSAVITYFGTCDDAVAESPGFKLPLKEDDVVTLNKLASNCMAISTLLK